MYFKRRRKCGIIRIQILLGAPKKLETTATMCCDFQELKFKNYQSNILAFHCNCKAVHKTSDFSSSVQLKNRFKFFFQATLNPIRHMHI